MSEARRSKRGGDTDLPRARSRSDSIPSSSAKRKSSQKTDPDRDRGSSNPTARSFSSTTPSPYPAAPSVASSYATANTTNTTNPTNLPRLPSDRQRNESMQDPRAGPQSDVGRESRTKRKSERRRDRSSDSDNAQSSRPSKDDRRRSSRKEKPKRTDSERALDNHRASMVENQFPGEFPSTFAEPYRPPGLAADYYGDHGESVASQPGVRPAQPSIVIAADQAHLHEATVEAAPPPEPSSLGQVGAAASFYGGTSDFESDPPPRPSTNGKRASLKPARQSTGPASSRSSPDAEGRLGPLPYSAMGPGPAAAAAAAAAAAGAAPVVGHAAEYFSPQFNPDLSEGGANATASAYGANAGRPPTTPGVQNSAPGTIRPPGPEQRPSSGSNLPMYGAAAAGMAAVGAGAYYASHHTTEQHHAMDNAAAATYGPQNTAPIPSGPQSYQSQPSTQQRRRRKGPLGTIVDFFQDPRAVAEYEAYTEAIGVCKYCFEPGSSPRDAPRKHHYSRRASDARFGSSTRVDKLNRYQSSEDEKRRRSSGKKWVATGLAGYGIAQMTEAATNRKNDFDDAYSVKSGRPEGLNRVSFAAEERVSQSRRRTQDGHARPPRDARRDNETVVRKDKKTGELYEEKVPRRRRESSPSDRWGKGAAATIGAGVVAAGLASAAGRQSRSKSPKKRYYSKRVSPNHSFVDLSATAAGGLGFGSFFSSPSANQRKGKKPKGLGFFNFTNASSSSSDADLAFGAGSVRRKKGRRDDRKGRDNEILGLAATGVALAAEGQRQDRKGKRRADLLVGKEPRNDRSRRHDQRRRHSSASESDPGNDDWSDTSDDEASVDSALAYGGRLSARQSRESLTSNDGTDKWAWRWNKGKRPPKKSSEDVSRLEPVVAGLAGATIGVAATSSSRFGPAASTASGQSLQQLDPIPLSDTTAFVVDRKTSAVSPRTEVPPRIFPAPMVPAPLAHPQPVAPISSAVYSRQAAAPDGPPVFAQYPPQPLPAPLSESPTQLPGGYEAQRPHQAGKPSRRRNSSPTPSPIPGSEFDDDNNSRRRASTRDSVKFDLTEDQAERDRRAQARRRLRRDDRKSDMPGDGASVQHEASLERERDEISSSRRTSTDARTARELEIEKELERLYEEDRQQREAQKSKRADTWPAVTAVAAMAAMAAAQSPSPEDEPRGDREERQSRRKSAMKKTTTTSPAVDDDRSDSQQRRIARMAAARVKASSSPVHEDYASYFVPPELAGTVQEHNFAAEHRDDPVQELAQIMEVVPRTGRRKDTFDPFLYRPFGIEPEDDPRRHPWPVPLLDIIEPTPPVSVRGDMSPRPTQEPESPEVPEGPEISEVAPARTQQRSPSVTWGEHRTHEYEVVTPLEDHDEFVPTPTSQSSQPASDLAETTPAEVNAERSEPVTGAGHTNGVPLSSAQNDGPPPPDVVKAPQPPSDYGHDIEFAAVLAAATEGAGFDPSIVVDDPTYHRRDSPPGSGGLSSYRAPYAETASDLGMFHDYSLPPQRGFVEGSLPPTPADEVSQEALEAAHRQQSQAPAEEDQFDVEPKMPGGFSVFDHLDGAAAGTVKSVNHTPTETPVVASMADEAEKRPKETNGLPEPDTPAAESARSRAIEPPPSEKLARSSTLDEVHFETALAKSDQQVSYASDPEGFPAKTRSTKKVSNQADRGTEAVIVGAAATAVPTVEELVGRDRRRRKLEREDDDYYDKVPSVSVSEPGATTSGDSKKSRRRSKRDSETWDDAKSVASPPAEMKDDRESGKKSKKKGKREGDVPDEDTMSVSSLPADLNGDRASSRTSKEKKSGGLFGLFSSSKSDTSSPQKRSSKDRDRQGSNGRDPKSEDLDEPKRKSKRKSTDKDLDDPSSDVRRSRGDSPPSARDGARQQSPEDEFLSSEEVAQDRERTEDGKSFLGERPEMPTVRDGASGLTAKAHLEAEQDRAAQLPLVASDPGPGAVRSRSVSPRTIPAPVEDQELPPTESSSPSTQRDQFRQRHLAEIRTSDMFPSPLATSSPTAVPLQFRRLPASPGFARSASVGSTAADSPMSPLATPRSRQGRPTSTEFRNSREFRPLYLVERHSSIKQPEPEIEETYPSLPSSRTSSAHPSMENLRGEDQSDSLAEKRLSLSQLHDRGRNFSYWRDDRPASPDYLDSATVTPTATEFPKEVRRERPKGEFHSPSELLQDPARQLAKFPEHQSPPLSSIVLPSVGSPASSVAKHDSTSPPLEPPAPAQDQPPADHKIWGPGIGLGLGLAGTAASALLTSQLAGHGETAAATPDEVAPKADHPPELPLPSTVSATRLVENATLADPVVSPDIEVASTTPPTDDDVALPPIPRQKRKKDGKKRKPQDLTDESVEASSRGVGDKVENVDSLAASSSAEPVSAPTANVRNLSSDITAPGVSVPQEPEHDVLDGQAPAQRTTVEVENPDYFATKHDDMQAFLEPAIGSEIPVVAPEMTKPATPEEAPSQTTEDQVTVGTMKSIVDEEERMPACQTDEPVVRAPAPEEADTSSQEKPSGDSIDTPDKDLIASETPSLPEEKTEAPILSARELVPAMPAQQGLDLSLNSALGVVDDTDRTEGHDQKASRDSVPFDKSVAAPAVGAAQLPQTSALEEALAKAKAARGTGPEVSQEEVFEAFRPRAALEPPFGHGRLDTIIEGSREGSNVDLAQVDAAVEKSSEDPAILSTAKSDTDMKTEGDTTKSREVETFVAEPEEITQAEAEAPKLEETTQNESEAPKPEEAAITKDPVATVTPVKAVAILDPSINPFGDDYVLDKTDGIDNKAATTSPELNETDPVRPEGASAAATPPGSPAQPSSTVKDLNEPIEELSWAQTSKSGKRKAKKGRTSTLISEASTPVTEMSSTESIDQPIGRQLDTDTSPVATKKGKKSKKKVQALGWTAEDSTLVQEDAIKQAEGPLEKAGEIEKDSAQPARVDDLPMPRAKKAKKNKSRQALNLADEAVTPQTEESIDTATESQSNARTVEAVTDDLAWAATKKGKKDKGKGKKSALLDKTTPESDVATEVETTPASVPVEEQVSAVNDESPVSIPVAEHDVQWPGDEPSMPGAFGEVSVPPNEAPIPRDEPSLPPSETLTTQTEATPPLNEVKVPEHNLHSSTPAEVSQFSAPEPHDRQVPDVAGASQSVVSTLHETRVSELVEANLPSGSEQHGQQEPDTAMAEEVSKPQGPDEVSDSHEAPLQPQELEEAQTLSGSSGDREVSMVQDLHRVPEPSNVPQPAVDVGEDRSTSTLRDSRWALVFGELQQRKLSQPTGEDRQTLAAQNIEQETQPSVPAEITHQTDMPGEKIETVMATDTRLDPDHLHPKTEELSREQMTESKVGATADDLQADQQAHHAAPEEQSSNIVSQTAPVAQVVHNQIQEEAQSVTVERSESHSISQPVMEVDDSRDQIRGGSQPIIGEEPESHPVSRSVTEVQDSRDQMGEESQPIVVEEPESHPISKPITEVQDIRDQMGEESQPIVVEEPESHPISEPTTEVQDIRDQMGEESQPIIVEEPESHLISKPTTEVQDIRDQIGEESQPIIVEEPESHLISKPTTEVQDIRDHMGDESQPKIMEEPESHTISESSREVQDIQDQMAEKSPPKIIEERESHTVSESVREVQDIQDQMAEQSQPKIIEESESHTISESVRQVQHIQDQMGEESQLKIIKESESHTISESVRQIQDIQDQMGEESQPITAEKSESHPISEPVMEAQDIQNQTSAEAQPTIVEELESHPVSEPVMKAQDIRKQMHEESQPIMVEEPESRPISEPVMEVQDIRDQIPEEAHKKGSEEIVSQTIVQPVRVAQDLHDQMQEQAQGPALEELASHTVSQPVAVTQGMHDQRHEQAHHGTTEESASNTPSKPVTTVSDMHDQTYDEAQDTIVEPTVAQEMHDQVPGQDQHTMQESRMENLAERQDVVLTNDREVSAYRPDPETDEAAESGNVTQLKQPEEEKPADQFPAPAPSAEEQVHELSSAPTKRGKKEKKSKNRRSTFDESVEPSSDSSRAKDIIPGSTTAGAATNSEIETPPVPTNVEEASGEADVFSRAPAKKNKKNKKKNKALASAEDTSTPASDGIGEDRSTIPEPTSLASDTPVEKSISEETEVAEDAHAKDESRSQMEALSSLPGETDNQLLISDKEDQHQAVLPLDEPIPEYSERQAAQTPGDEVLVTEPAPAQEESIISKEEPATVQEGPKDDSLTTTSKKKGKKEKKKHGSTLETSGTATPQTEDEPPLGKDNVDSAVPLTAEPAGDDEWGFKTKKSKGKKKKSKTVFSPLEGQVEPTLEERLQASPDTIKGNDAEIDRDAVERIQADVSATSITGQDSGERSVKSPAPELAEVKGRVSTPESEPVLGIPEKGLIADQLEEQPVVTEGPNLVEESILEHQQTAATKEELSWPPALDQNKGDKTDNEHDRPTADLGEPLEEIRPSTTTGLLENSEIVQEDDQKDVADSGLTSGPDHAADAEIIPETKTILEHQGSGEQERSADETIEERRQPVLSDVGIPESATKDDTRASSAKKGKKEKKTKRKSVVEPEELAFGNASAAAATDHHREASENSQAEILVPEEMRAGEKAPIDSAEPSGPPDSAQDITSAAEPEQDAWTPPAKRTKKGKKKTQRQSTYDESSATPSVSGTPSEPSHADKDNVLSANQQEQNVLGEKLEDLEAVAPVLMAALAPSAQVAEDDFGNTGKKKSKKGRKKKNTILSWDEENDGSLEQQTETSTPVNELESGNLGGERTDLERKESIAVPDVKGSGLDSSQVLESAVVAEHSLPGAHQPFNVAESTTIEGTSSDARELVTGGHPVAAAEEDGTRKPENAAKNEADSTSEAVENGKQDLDSREAPSHLSSIPEAFEGIAESEPLSLHISEISAAQERSAPPMIQEPQIALEAAPKHALPEHDASHPGQADNIGLGTASLGSEAGASRAISDQNSPFEEELLGQHESRHHTVQDQAVRDQAVHDHENQHERAQQHSLPTPEMLPTLEASKPRPSQPTWSFANLKEDTVPEHANRDSGIQVSDSSPIQSGYIQGPLRDSGYVPSPVAAASREITAQEEDAHVAAGRPPRPISLTSSSEDLRQKSHDRSLEPFKSGTTREMDDPSLLPSGHRDFHHDESEVPARGHPSPVDSTTKDRSSALFNSSPSSRTDDYGVTPRLDTRHVPAPITDLHRSPSIHGHRSGEELRALTPSRSPNRRFRPLSDAPNALSMQETSQKQHNYVLGPFPTGDGHDRDLSPPRTPLQTIHEHLADTSHSNRRRRPLSEVGSPDRGHESAQRLGGPAVRELDSRREADPPGHASDPQTPPRQPRTSEAEQELRTPAVGDHGRDLAEVGGVAALSAATLSAATALAAEELRPSSRDMTPEDAKSLGKSKSRSTSSKQLRQSQTSLENIASSSTHDPVREKGKAAARDMAEVFNGYGEFPGAPMSPTRPPSVRSRRSMQQLKDLEARLDQLLAENRSLATAKINAEQQLQDLHIAQSRTDHASQEALELRDLELREKDEAIAKMREVLETMQKEVARLTELNEGFTATHDELRSDHEQRYSHMEQQHAETHQLWQDSSRELESLKSKHAELSTGMEEIVERELDTRLAEKDAEIQRLHDELEDAKAKIRELQQQILVGQSDEIIVARDEDYFDNACQQLCQHVQQWVLRFSKFSDTRGCRLTTEVRDEKVIDRFDNAILDGSDVDLYLVDRVRRRDVFMSVVMTMIWDYIFTRYLFGMDREQRQKLKLLEKNLSEVGPQSAVHRWRAMTLTLLSKRASFRAQRASDTEAVVQEIYDTLARFLPPPQHLQGQIQESLRNVMKTAVDLSIEMRTQRAEYIMLPPLQPEYDTNGDLARQVYFNAALMNERSGETTSNEELEAQQAVVRMVLFPLVVKKGSDSGEGDEEIVVCPAQVLVARPRKDKNVVKTVSGDRMSMDQANRSVQSFAPSVLDPTNVI